MTRHTFTGAAPAPSERDAFLEAYLSFLATRNGGTADALTFERRDARMAELAALPGQYSGEVDVALFDRLYVRFDRRAELSDEMLALLALVKLNCAEAHGVDIMTRKRAHLLARKEPLYRVERVLTHEETYHTRLLVGATQHFASLQVGGPWQAPLPLHLFLLGLSRFPPALFHSVLLGAEIAGVFHFEWLLRRVGQLFPHDPDVRDSIEARLIEILIDEVGHITFNRLACGGIGRRFAPLFAGVVVNGVATQIGELAALGLDSAARRKLGRFDFHRLPRVVRDQAFFI